MPPRGKNATPQSAPTASQSEGNDDSESSSSEVQINVTPDDHPPRATRSRAARAILQDTPPQSEEGGNHSGNEEDSGSKSDAASGSQSDDGSGGSAGSESGSKEDATTSPPMVNTEDENGVREEADVADEDMELTTDDTVGKSIDIFEQTINKKLHGPEYTAPVSIGLFEGEHHEVTSDTTMEDQNSRERGSCNGLRSNLL
ncbi:hypothetical protein KY285_020339 [Solanum tuberosum]|nr:hypothetical protein KY285_020339 [Solanum tuberosum]